MAQFSYLISKQHSTTALQNWRKFISCSVKIRRVISPETANFLSMTISSSCFRCRANQFQMKSWISMNNLFQPPQNLPLRSRDTNFSQKAGTFCSIHLWSSAGLCLTAFTTVTGFWPAMAPMSTSHATLRTKGLLSTKEKKLIMQSTSLPFTTSPIRLTAIFLSREKEAS